MNGCTEEVRAIVTGLRASGEILAGFVASIPEGELGRIRGEGCWSVAGHVAHLAAVQPVFEERVRRILEEDVPEFEPYVPDTDAGADQAPAPSAALALADFTAGRNRIMALLEGAAPADWRRIAVHHACEHYGLLILARHILMHDHWHIYRMEQLWLARDEYLTCLDC